MKKSSLALALFPLAIVFIVALGLSCAGTNPPSAPFGSTVSLLDPPGDVTLPRGTQFLLEVKAQVLDPDGLPLNDVKVDWRLSFAGANDLVEDTNGDGIADARALQFVDPDACEEVGLSCELVDSKFYVAFGALKDSPVLTLSNNSGVSRILILAFGDFPVDPANLEVSIATDVDNTDFSVTNP